MPKVDVAYPSKFNEEMHPPRYPQASQPRGWRRAGLSRCVGYPEGGGKRTAENGAY